MLLPQLPHCTTNPVLRRMRHPPPPLCYSGDRGRSWRAPLLFLNPIVISCPPFVLFPLLRTLLLVTLRLQLLPFQDSEAMFCRKLMTSDIGWGVGGASRTGSGRASPQVVCYQCSITYYQCFHNFTDHACKHRLESATYNCTKCASRRIDPELLSRPFTIYNSQFDSRF